MTFTDSERAFLEKALAPVRERYVDPPRDGDGGSEPWEEFADYRDRPVEFVQEIVGAKPWEFSREFLTSIRDNPFTTVRAARGVAKTFTNAMAALWWMSTRRAIVLAFGAREDNIKNQLFAELGLWHGRARRPLPGRVDLMHWRLSPRHYMQGIATKSDLGAIGFHAGRAVPEDPDVDLSEEALAKLYEEARTAGTLDAELLILIDEAPAVPDKIILALHGSVQGPSARLAMTGNPLQDPDEEHEFARSHRRGSRYRRIKVALEPSDDELDADVVFEHVPNWLSDGKFLAGAKSDWGESDPRYRADVQARFSSATLDSQFVPSFLIRECEHLEIEDPGDVTARHIGFDVARSGRDDSVATLWINGVLSAEYVLPKRPGEVLSLVTQAGMILELAHVWGVDGKSIPDANIHIDVGMGAGVIDALKDLGHLVDSVDFGGAPKGEWSELVGETKFLNRKAELFWVMRRALQEKIASIPPKYRAVRQQLGWHVYEIKARAAGSVIAHAIDKDEIKERYGRSPDQADSAVIAWSRTGGPPRIRTVGSMRELGRLTRRRRLR